MTTKLIIQTKKKERKMSIINNDTLVKEVEKIVQQILNDRLPKDQLEIIWGYLNKLEEKVKVLEIGKMDKMNMIEGLSVEDYMNESYDRIREDEATEVVTEIVEVKEK